MLVECSRFLGSIVTHVFSRSYVNLIAWFELVTIRATSLITTASKSCSFIENKTSKKQEDSNVPGL